MSVDMIQDDVNMVKVDCGTKYPNPLLDMCRMMGQFEDDIEHIYFTHNVQMEDCVSVGDLSLSQVLAEQNEEIAKMSSQVECGCQEIVSLTRCADFHCQMTQLWRKDLERKTLEYDDLTEQHKQMHLREELVQGMMIGAEKQLWDTKLELKTTKDKIMGMRRIHNDKVGQLEKELHDFQAKWWAAKSERWKLTGRMEESIWDLDENHGYAM